MTQTELEQLNLLLPPLFTELRDRLRVKHGAELAAWLETCESEAVMLKTDTPPSELIRLGIESLEFAIGDSYYLDMDRWDGVSVEKIFTENDKASLAEVLAGFFQKLTPAGAMRDIVDGIQKNDMDPESKERSVFFIFGAMDEAGLSEEVQALWILESGLWDHYDYMFLMEDGAQVHQAWRVCADVLPPEVLPLLDLEYIDIE